MRERFDAQLCIGSIPISEIIIPTKSYDEFPSYLYALQDAYNKRGVYISHVINGTKIHIHKVIIQ
jgi:hypothetical protein